MAKRNPCADPQPGDVLSIHTAARWNTRVVTARTAERVSFWWNGTDHDIDLARWEHWSGGAYRELAVVIYQAPDAST